MPHLNSSAPQKTMSAAERLACHIDGRAAWTFFREPMEEFWSKFSSENSGGTQAVRSSRCSGFDGLPLCLFLGRRAA